MKIECPNCKREVRLDKSAWRPFCSERCKMVDLGAWVLEGYKISDDTDEDAVYAPDTQQDDDGLSQ